MCFNPSNEDCHRTLRHFLQLSLKWLNSWFSLIDWAQMPSCLSWKCAYSSVILVFIPQEMAASLIFFCSVTKIKWHEILGGGEILKDSWMMNFRFGFLRKALPSAALLKLCAAMIPGLWECSSREESLGGAPVVSQFSAFLSWGPASVNHYWWLTAPLCIGTTGLKC